MFYMFYKPIRLFVLLAFLCARPAQGKESSQDRHEARDIPARVLASPPPSNIGHVTERFSGSGGCFVIHIRDSHCNFEAQKNIARILGHYWKILQDARMTGPIPCISRSFTPIRCFSTRLVISS